MTIFLIWIIGLVLTIRGVIEIYQINAPASKRCIAIIIIFFTSWLGAFIYTFYAKYKMQVWLN